MKKKIPTAKELSSKILKLHNKTIFYNEGDLDKLEKNITKKLIKFAKLHVKAALEKALENAELDRDAGQDLNGISVNKESILNAYPDENIK